MNPGLTRTAQSLGNEIREEWPTRVLKIYRRRRSRLREVLGRFSHACIERKRGTHPHERWETERTAIAIWAREGFRVPRILDDAPPVDVDGPSLWLERVDGQTFFWLTHDPKISLGRKQELAARLGRDHSRRHRRARELGEIRLLHEHPTTKHVLVSNDELVTIDHEGGFAADYPLTLAIAFEVAGFLRPLWTGETLCLDAPLPAAYLQGYGDVSLLSDACRAWFGSEAWQPLRRASDRRRRGDRSKSTIMDEVRDRLRGGTLG